MLEEKVDLSTVRQPKGRIKVEIADANTGEVLQKAENDNFISKGMQHLYEIQMKNLFQRNKAVGGYRLEQIGDPFRRMYLTDADHDGDPENEWLMRGNIIGTAFTDNALMENNGDLGGQYNNAESFTSDDMVRIVIDFPATSANGTINSVYFHAGGDVMSRYNDYAGIRIVDNRLLSKIVHYGDRVYAIQSYSGTYAYSEFTEMDKDYNVLGVCIAANGNYGPIVDGRRERWPGGNSSFTFHNNRLYFVGRDENMWHNANYDVKYNAAVWSISIDDLEFGDDVVLSEKPSFRRDFRFGKISTSSNDTSNSYRTNAGITYDPETSRFIIGDSELKEFIITDNEFNILQKIPVYTSFGDTIRDFSLLQYHDGDFIMGRYTIDIKTGYMIDRGHNTDIKGFTPDGLPIVGSYIVPKIGFSSRAKLSTPVTKTSTHIMKVTYDFVLPSTIPSQDDF